MSNRSNEIPEGFKMTELGPLPEEWGVVKLDAVVLDILTGDWGETNPGPDLQQCYVLRGTDFYQALKGSFTNTPIRYLKTSSIQKRQLRAGDILIELSGGSKDQPTGRIMIVNHEIKSKSSLPLVFSNFVKRLNVKTDSWPEFFWQYWEHLYQNSVTRIYEKRTTGIRNFKLNDFLASEHIPLPPLPEQKAIAGVLSTIRQAVETQDKIIAATRELKRSLMKHLFTYGPVPVAEAKNVPLKDTEIGPVPEHWEVVRLGDVTDGPEYGYTATASSEIIGPKFLRITDIQNGVVNWVSVPYCECSPEEEEKHRLQSGDILFARIGATTGKTYLTEDSPPSIFASYLIRVRCKSSLLPDYLSQFTTTKHYWNQINASKGGRLKQGINIPVLKSLLIPFPSLPEQKQIAHMLSGTDKKIHAEEERKASLQTLFRTMLHHLMTGKLRAKDVAATAS